MLKLAIVMGTISLILCSTHITDPTSLLGVVHEAIPNTEYAIYTNQTISLTYDAYPGVFSMDLKKKSLEGNETFLKMQDYEQFQENAGYNTEEPGCYAFQREITTSPALRINMPSSQKEFFTDIVAFPQMNKSFLIRNDFKIYEVKVGLSDSSTSVHSLSNSGIQSSFIDLLDKNATTANPLIQNPFLAVDPISNRVFALTRFGGVSFDATQNVEDVSSLRFTSESFHHRSHLYDFHYIASHKVHHHIKTFKCFFVAAGPSGVDVYSINDGHVEFRTNYNAQSLALEQLNVVDLDSSADGKKLYILDPVIGFFYLDISNVDHPRMSDFSIPIKRATAFDHKLNTFIFIATTVNNQDYAVEVFIDFEKSNYFFNRFYEDEMVLYDIQMFDFYAVLVGYDAHKLIFHSVYQGFINAQLEHHTIFTEPELVKVQEYNWDPKNYKHQIIGLGRFEFKTFMVNYVHPVVKCHSSEPYQQLFLLSMNSTTCNGKKNGYQFSSCNVVHQFTFTTENVFISTSSKIGVIVGTIMALILIFSLAWALYLCWQKWGKHLQTLDHQIMELRKQEKYGSFEGEKDNMQKDDM